MKIDVGGFNPILGKSYGELAAESRTNHKSQGAALTPARGESMDYFTLVAGDPAPHDPMEGVVTTWDRVSGGEKIAGMVDEVTRSFSLTAPEKSVAGLVADRVEAPAELTHALAGLLGARLQDVVVHDIGIGRQSCPVTGVRKLTPDEVAALPKNARP